LSRKLKGTEYVPATPFSQWLQERYEFHVRRFNIGYGSLADSGPGPAIAAVCQEIGWEGDAGTRRLYRYRHQLSESRVGKKRGKNGDRNPGISVTRTAEQWPRRVVEDALHRAGVLFEDLYPEIAAAEDRPLEPAMDCWTCSDVVHPIGGRCPWCETVLVYEDELMAA